MIPYSSITHDKDATVLEWQPNGRLLAIGWGDGFLSIWLVNGKSKPSCAYSNASQHESAITVMRWNPSGKRLISGDKVNILHLSILSFSSSNFNSFIFPLLFPFAFTAFFNIIFLAITPFFYSSSFFASVFYFLSYHSSILLLHLLNVLLQSGLVVVWTVDARGVLAATRQYRKKGSISSAVFCLLPSRSSSSSSSSTSNITITSPAHLRKADLKQNMISPPFFFGTDRGGLVFADDLGHCTDVQQLSSGIDIMLFFEERSRLVLLTRSLLLTQYQVGEDGKVTRVMQVKLSVAGDLSSSGIHSVVWAGAGVLAIATQERMLRLLDLTGDESYNLSLSMVSDVVSKQDCVYTVVFNPLDRYLAIGTAMGAVVVWKFVGAAREVSSIANGSAKPTCASDWELHFKTPLHSPIRELAW